MPFLTTEFWLFLTFIVFLWMKMMMQFLFNEAAGIVFVYL